MELTGELLIGAPRDKVWEALNDPPVLRRCIPGCEDVQQVSPAERHVRVALKLGPVRARFVGKVRMRDVRPGEGCVLDFEGSGGPAGFARGSSTVALAPEGAEGAATRLTYTATASVGGKLGQVGGRMIDASAKKMADQFFTALQAQLAARPASSPSPEPVVPAQPSTATTPPAPGAVAPSRLLRPTSVPLEERVRAIWFVLGAASTGFGVWLASLVFS